jgi:hypothetical protein
MSEVQALVQALQQAITQANAILQMYGIQLYIYKVKLYMHESENNQAIDEDCQNAKQCIDWIVRIKCANERLCMEMKKAYLSAKKQ